MALIWNVLDLLPRVRPERDTALALTERMSAVTHLLSGAEHLLGRDEELPGRFNDWSMIRESKFGNRSPLLRRVLDVVGDRRVTRALHAAQVAGALAILAPTGRTTRLVANSALAVSSGLLFPRHVYGTDGTDQVGFLVQTAAAVARAADNRPALVDAALWYIASQSTMSYTISGWAKLLGPSWRNGEALPGVLRTYTYGDKQAYQLVRRFRRTARVVGTGVLAMECLFPFAYAARGRAAPAFVGAAALFHLVNARVMGLHRFVPAFVSMHPAVLYTAGPREIVARSGTIERRDDLFPAVLGAVGAAAAAALYRGYRSRRKVVTRGGATERRLATSTGNVLAFQRSGPEDAATPLIFIEGGLAAPLECNSRLQRQLSKRFTVVCYDRAGYGSSTYRPRAGYDLDIAVQDLVDLVTDQGGSRPVVLAGHSLGGCLVWRAAPKLAARIGRRLTCVALLDPTHPDEMLRSRTQHVGAAVQDASLTEVSASLRLGLGALMARPEFVTSLPPDVRQRLATQFRDPGLWTTARREWRAAQALFTSPDGRLQPIDVPALVLTAGQTARVEPIQAQLHQEMAAAAPKSEHHVIDGAAHDTIVIDKDVTARVAALITDFVEQLHPPVRQSPSTVPVA